MIVFDGQAVAWFLGGEVRSSNTDAIESVEKPVDDAASEHAAIVTVGQRHNDVAITDGRLGHQAISPR